MSIYDVPGIIKDAWPAATIPNNILKGFEVTGIMPFNPDRFSLTDYAPALTTDHPLNSNSEVNPQCSEFQEGEELTTKRPPDGTSLQQHRPHRTVTRNTHHQHVHAATEKPRTKFAPGCTRRASCTHGPHRCISQRNQTHRHNDDLLAYLRSKLADNSCSRGWALSVICIFCSTWSC